MINLADRLQRRIENLSDDLNAGIKQLSQNPVKYLAQVGLDYVDAVGAVVTSYAFCDTNGEVLGKYRIPLMFAGATVALLGPIVSQVAEEGLLDLSYNPLSRASHRLTRNIELGVGSLFFFWNNGKENIPVISQIVCKTVGVVLAIPSYSSDRARIKAPILKSSIQQYRKAEAARWKDFDKKL